MIYFVCTSLTCSFAASVTALDEEEASTLIGHESDWFPDKYPCPECGSVCTIQTRLPPGESVPVELTTQEAFAAFSGAGLPSEQECSAARVQELLLSRKVVAVIARHIKGTNRCTLDRLELEGGLILHLAASAHGACVHRIQAPHSFTEAASEPSPNHPADL